MASSYTPSVDIGGSVTDGTRQVEITYAITCHTDGSMTAISTDTDTSGGRTYTQWITGLKLYLIEAFPTSGGTAPDAADVTVLMNSLDLLGGNGTNLVHATATYSTYPMIDGYPALYPIRSVLSIALANQSTASANFTLRLTFIS